MTIAALRALLDEEQPHVRRHAAPRLPRTHFSAKETQMTQNPPPGPPRPGPPTEADAVPVGRLLAWGDAHPDKTVQDQAARARAALGGLRTRHQADRELTVIDTETAQLEGRLAALRARRAELQPKHTRAPRDYEPGVVRAWARQHGHEVPARGQIPKAVLTAWRTRDEAQ